ncbi:hypothetical protein Cgig2_012710 [Carnegiea gigantea]|uniref:Uncharacterized protein n=1 Tax=Carnegiea gigantea TaxID=171969 RepID=A0A9Q1Q403_9CARY|nr:hypothetical protein Cgig2_012710 [Carnegiea gigantea]
MKVPTSFLAVIISGKVALGLGSRDSRVWEGRLSEDEIKNFMLKARKCSGNFLYWNKDNFDLVGAEIHKFEDELKLQHDAKARCDILRQIPEWRRKEEMMWWQRVRVDVLKYRESNTRWHAKRPSPVLPSDVTAQHVTSAIIAGQSSRRHYLTVQTSLPLLFPLVFGVCKIKSKLLFPCLVLRLVKDRSSLVGKILKVRPYEGILLPRDVDVILNILLCSSWPSDMLTSCIARNGKLPARSHEVHILAQCPLVLQVWERSKPDGGFWGRNFRSLTDWFELTAYKMDSDQMGKAVAIIRKIWNSRNRLIFKPHDGDLTGLSNHAVDFVMTYMAAKDRTTEG